MRTQHNFCTQQLRYVGITMIVILFGLNLCAESQENSFQEVLKVVLFGGTLENFVRVRSSRVSAHTRRNLSPVVGNYLGTAVRALRA